MCKHCLYQTCRIRYICVSATRQIRYALTDYSKNYIHSSKANHGMNSNLPIYDIRLAEFTL